MTQQVCEQLIMGQILQLSVDDKLTLQSDAAIAVDQSGVIMECGPRAHLCKKYPGAVTHDFGEKILVPGFIDAHVHFPQMEMIGCHNHGLLHWLDTYAFVEEQKYADEAFSVSQAQVFIQYLLRHGTTAAAVYAASSLQSALGLLAAARKQHFPAVIGKVSMDCGAPQELLVDAALDYEHWQKLLREKDVSLALTPRFALSCSKELMQQLGHLQQSHPQLFVQTHFGETLEEIQAVKNLYPEFPHYLSIYQKFGLLGPRTLLAHGIHVSDAELDLMAETGSTAVHCPTSNLFLGSGLFPWQRYQQKNIPVCLGSDVGGGTSFSLWQTMAEAYKIQRLADHMVRPADLLALATVAGAKALGWHGKRGRLAAGYFADLQVIDWRSCRILRARVDSSRSTDDLFLALVFHWESRLTHAVFTGGKRASI